MGQYEGTILRLPDGSICLWGRKHLVSYHINVGFTAGTWAWRARMTTTHLCDATIKHATVTNATVVVGLLKRAQDSS
jgi:hypothetical protein